MVGGGGSGGLLMGRKESNQTNKQTVIVCNIGYYCPVTQE